MPSVWPKRIAFAAMTGARFALGLGMMPYGISKLCNLQFQLGASAYAQPLGDAKGTGLLWATLGYSPAFQFLLGAFEAVPALMLLFARTRRLGALLLLPVSLNVAMMNQFLDLWPQTQLISAVFLALNLFLVLYDFPIYLAFLVRVLERPAPIANRKLRIAGKISAFAVSAAVLVPLLLDFRGQVQQMLGPVTDFVGERQINRAGTWKLESLRVGGQPSGASTDAVLYFDISKRCVYERGGVKQNGTFEASKTGGTFRLVGLPLGVSGDAVAGSYKVDRDRLLLDGLSGGQPVSLVLRRYRWGHGRG